jgi:alpha-glucosidase
MTVGEVFGPPENIVRYYGGKAADGLHLAFNFPLVRIFTERWRADHVRRRVDQFEAALPSTCWPNYVLGNHDVDRFASRVNSDGAGQARARVAAMLLLTLRGTPFIYYGEELGMENTNVPEHMLQDPSRFFANGRDPERTPMQWTRDGGFTRGDRTWLPYGDLRVNVADQSKDPQSLLSLYKRLIWFRRSSDALRFGDYAAVDGLPEGIFAYTRTHGADRLLTILNFTNHGLTFDLPEELSPAETILGTHAEPAAARHVQLEGNEGRLLRLA